MSVNRKFPEYVILVDPTTLLPYKASTGGGGGGTASSVNLLDNLGNDITNANPLPVAVVTALPAGSNTVGKVDQGAAGAAAWLVTGTVAVSALPALPTGANVIGAVTQSGTWNVGLSTGSNVIGAVTQSGTWNVGLSAGANTVGKIDQGTAGASAWLVTGAGGTFPVTGTVAVSSLPALPTGANVIGAVTQSGAWSVSVSGSVTVTGTVAASQSGTWNVGLSAGSNTVGKVDQGAGGASAWKVDGTGGTFPVTGSVSLTSIVSTSNSSITPLGIAGTFTGVGENVSGFAAISVNVATDQYSIVGGLSFQWSSDAVNWDLADNFTVALNTPRSYVVRPKAKFFRLVYNNDGVAQTFFRLQSILHTTIPVGGYTADGANETMGYTTDAAVTGDTAGTISAKLRSMNYTLGAPGDVVTLGNNPGTVSSKLRGVVSALTDVWDQTNHWFDVGVTGMSPAGSGLVGNPVPIGAIQLGVVRAIACDASGRMLTVAVGAGSAGSNSGGAPVQIGGLDNTSIIRAIKTDAAGNLSAVVAGTTSAGSTASLAPVIVGGSDPSLIARNISVTASGHQNVVVTAALPAGANVIGQVTQSGTWTMQQGTPPWAIHGSVGSTGALTTTNPVVIGVNTGGNSRFVTSPPSGRNTDGSTFLCTGMFGYDGALYRDLLVDGSQNLKVNVNASLPAGTNVIGGVTTTQLPATLGPLAQAASLSVTLASEHTTVIDGQNHLLVFDRRVRSQLGKVELVLLKMLTLLEGQSK